MRYRAVIFDVYRTLLHVGAPPVDAALQWETLWRTTLPGTVPPAFDGFHFGCSTLIAREHAQAKDRGIRHPEIYWPSITTEAFPELKTLSAPGLDRFLFGHAQLQRTITLATGAADVLLRLNEARVLMGISSNAQPYTLHELRNALASSGLSPDMFESSLVFWSFEAGFSKPDPDVFKRLDRELGSRGVSGTDICMVGDREDNDIAPARAIGWSTWHYREPGDAGPCPGGNWHEFLTHLT